jgi:hypothetical protein
MDHGGLVIHQHEKKREVLVELVLIQHHKTQVLIVHDQLQVHKLQHVELIEVGADGVHGVLVLVLHNQEQEVVQILHH